MGGPSALVALHASVALFGFAALFGKWIALPATLIVLGRTVTAAATSTPTLPERVSACRLTSQSFYLREGLNSRRKRPWFPRSRRHNWHALGTPARSEQPADPRRAPR